MQLPPVHINSICKRSIISVLPIKKYLRLQKCVDYSWHLDLGEKRKARVLSKMEERMNVLIKRHGHLTIRFRHFWVNMWTFGQMVAQDDIWAVTKTLEVFRKYLWTKVLVECLSWPGSSAKGEVRGSQKSLFTGNSKFHINLNSRGDFWLMWWRCRLRLPLLKRQKGKRTKRLWVFGWKVVFAVLLHVTPA